MNLIIKRLSDEVESIKGDHLLYVQTEDGTNIRAEVCSSDELSNYIYILKSDHDIKQTIYFDL
jgi:translation initiation factor IF-1